MEKKNYRLLALDMDGTTLDSRKRIPPETTAAIRELTDRGIHVVIASGRGLAEFSDYEEELRGLHYAILISGGMVYDFQKAEPIYIKPIPLEDSLRLIEAGDEERAMVHILTIRESVIRESDLYHMKDFEMDVYYDMYERVCRRREDLAGYVREHPEEIAKINLYHRSVESRDRSEQKLQGLGLELVHAEVTGLEASPAGITKANGLEFLCDYLGIPMEETVAIGDAPNDIDILKSVGLSIAMGNASDEIKALCDAVTLDNDHNGVLEAIRKYF